MTTTDLDLDECRKLCEQMGQHARSFVDTTDEGSEAHGLAVIAQRQTHVLIAEVERLRSENASLRRERDAWRDLQREFNKRWDKP